MRTRSLFLAAFIVFALPGASAQQVAPPFMLTYGQDAPVAEGDPDFRQEIEILLPSAAGPHYVRIFDPAAGSPADTIFGRTRNTVTRFTLFGADSDDNPLVVAEYGPDGAPFDEFVTLAEVNPADGRIVGDRSAFTLLVEGTEGDDGNVYGVIASEDPEGLVSSDGVEMSTADATVTIPSRNLALEFTFAAPSDVDNIVIDTYDVVGGKVAYVTPFRSVIVPSSPQGEWRESAVEIAPDDRGRKLAVTISGGEETPNEASVRIFGQRGEERVPLPITLPPRALTPNGRPTARLESRPLDCRRVELDAGRSTDPEAEALRYTWRFRDGSTATGRRVVREFPEAGSHPVRLEVFDPVTRVGNGSAVEMEILVKDPPTAAIAPVPTVVGVGDPVIFDGSASSVSAEDATIARYEWLLTDGVLLEGAEVVHHFDVQGRYGVRLLVQDDSDHPCRSAAAQVVVTVNAPPLAEAGADLRVAANETFLLDGSASADPDGEIANHSWSIAPLNDTGGAGAPIATLSGERVEHIIETPGVYRVRLLVDDGTGVSNATDEDDLILFVNAAPVAEAGPDLNVAVRDLAPLDASGSRDADGRILSYHWDLGNGDTVQGRAPSYAFQRLGEYQVTLQVTDDSGLVNATTTDTLTVRVGPRPNASPSAEAGPDRHVTVGEPIQFDASGSQDSDGNLVGYAWEFGDGRMGAGLRTKHAYLAEGIYTIRLTVTDDSGLDNAKATDTAEVRVRPRPNTPPVAEAGPNRTAVVGERVVFDGRESADPDGAVLGYFWDFGDGARGRGPVIAHAWLRPGVYDVMLEVEDDSPHGDGRATDRATVTVNPVPNAAPTAVAGPDQVVALGETVFFNGQDSADTDGNLIAWVWALGDGRKATGPAVSYRYAAPGTYTVRLTVQDDSGRPNSRSEDTLEIVVNAPPLAEGGSDRAVAVGETVLLDGSLSHDPEGNLERHDWRIVDTHGATVAEASGARTEVTLENHGLYRVTLTVEDDAGVSNSVAEDTFAITVNAAPVAEAGSDLIVAAGTTVPFDATSSHDHDGLVVGYSWDFGNGDKGTGPRPVYAYHEVGIYNVVLTVTDDSSLSNSSNSTDFTVEVIPAKNMPPISEAGPDIAGFAGDRLTFDGSASRDPDGDILFHRWDFGDGRVAEGVGPAHVFWAPGTYEVTLTVRDDSARPNDTATDTLTATIDVRPNDTPVAEAGPDIAALAGERIVFDGSDSRDLDGTILNYVWDFGDGATARGVRPLYVYREPGTYTVQLTVVDDGMESGAHASDTLTVVVEPNPLWASVPIPTRLAADTATEAVPEYVEANTPTTGQIDGLRASVGPGLAVTNTLER